MKCPAITYVERIAHFGHVSILNDTRIWTEIRAECSYTLDEVYELAIQELDRFNKSPKREGMLPRELVGVRWADKDEVER